MHRTIAVVGTLGIAAAAGLWTQSSVGQERSSTTQSAPATRPSGERGGGGSVHTITLPTLDAPLPDGPNRQLVQANCSVCHSLRYITMQPHFSGTVWTNEVQKMIKTYGAPVPQQQVDDIIKYLVSVRGLEQSGT